MTDISVEYFNKKEEKERHAADSELRKGYYNGEKYHKAQRRSNILLIVYYIVAFIYGVFFVYRGDLSRQSLVTSLLLTIGIVIIPHAFYYYFVDIFIFVFDYLTKFVTSMSLNNLIAFVATIFISLFILSSIFTQPFIAALTPFIITFSSFLVILGIILRNSYLA